MVSSFFFFFSKKKLNNYKRIHLAYIWNFLELYKMIPTNNMTIDSSNALEGSLLSCMEQRIEQNNKYVLFLTILWVDQADLVWGSSKQLIASLTCLGPQLGQLRPPSKKSFILQQAWTYSHGSRRVPSSKGGKGKPPWAKTFQTSIITCTVVPLAKVRNCMGKGGVRMLARALLERKELWQPFYKQSSSYVTFISS